MSKTIQKIALIAAVAHAMNAAYCAVIGDSPKPAWDDAPDYMKASILKGVQMHLDNPTTTPEQSHAGWMAHKQSEGWVYGEKIDAEAKTHPCMLPYEQLPQEQRVKDYLFAAAVRSLAGLPDVLSDGAQTGVGSAPAAAAPAAAPRVDGFLPVKYVGRRETYREGLYGTGVVFAKGETKMIPLAKAVLMLRHPDVYVPGETTATAQTSPAATETLNKNAVDEVRQPETDAQVEVREAAYHSIATMNRAALAQYARANFNQELDPATFKDASEMRSKVRVLIDQLGLPS